MSDYDRTSVYSRLEALRSHEASRGRDNPDLSGTSNLGLGHSETLIIIATDPSKHGSTQARAYIKDARRLLPLAHLTMFPASPTFPAPPPSPALSTFPIDPRKQLGRFLFVCGPDMSLIFLSRRRQSTIEGIG